MGRWHDHTSDPSDEFRPGSAEGVLTIGTYDTRHYYPDNTNSATLSQYTITVTLDDDFGHAVTDTLIWTQINNVPPNITGSCPVEVHEGDEITLENVLQIAFTDPGWSNQPYSEETFTYSVRWEDGVAEHK